MIRLALPVMGLAYRDLCDLRRAKALVCQCRTQRISVSMKGTSDAGPSQPF